MIKVFAIVSIILAHLTAFGAQNERPIVQVECVEAARQAILDHQIEKLNLTPKEKAEFMVRWSNNVIENDDSYREDVASLEVICIKAFLMGAPLK